MLVSEGFQYQVCLLAMLEKWRRSFNNSRIFGTLLITKRNVYGFSLIALKLVHNYLSNKKTTDKNEFIV